jgi:hypothetical protein
MKNISTEHTQTNCVMCSAIAAAKAVVEQTRKEDSAIPVILRALGWEQSPNPWPAAVRALKDHAKSMVLSAELTAQLEIVARRDAWLQEYERHMLTVSEKDSVARKGMQKILAARYAEFQDDLAKLEKIKLSHGIYDKVSVHLKAMQSMGLLDLLGIKASDLTAARHAAKKQFKALPDMRLELKVTREDIVREFNLGREDMAVADLLYYLRTMVAQPSVKVKRHSNPRKQVVVDEGELKERLVSQRPAITINYSTGVVSKLR